METNKLFPCYCCGNLTLDYDNGNSFDICDTCGWEDDGVQNDDPEFRGGANTMSLNQAKEAFKNGLPVD